jgi:hypothetical protein
MRHAHVALSQGSGTDAMTLHMLALWVRPEHRRSHPCTVAPQLDTIRARARRGGRRTAPMTSSGSRRSRRGCRSCLASRSTRSATASATTSQRRSPPRRTAPCAPCSSRVLCAAALVLPYAHAPSNQRRLSSAAALVCSVWSRKRLCVSASTRVTPTRAGHAARERALLQGGDEERARLR